MPRLRALGKLNHSFLRLLMFVALSTPFVLAYHLRVSTSWDRCQSLLTSGMLAAGLCFYLVVALGALDHDLLRFGERFDRCLLYFGSRSYSLYVFHFPLFMIPWLIILHTAPWLFAHHLTSGFVHAVLFLATGLPIVEFSYRCVEQPAIRFGARFAARILAAERVGSGFRGHRNFRLDGATADTGVTHLTGEGRSLRQEPRHGVPYPLAEKIERIQTEADTSSTNPLYWLEGPQ